MENKIERYESPLALLEEGQYCEQRPILLEIDWETEEITAYTRDKNGGTPAREWHGLSSVYRLTYNLDASELSEWVQTAIIPIAEKLLPAFTAEWDGSNRVGHWAETIATGEDVGQLDQEITRMCEDDREVPQLQGDSPGLWDVREWANITKEELNADTTDEQIRALAAEIESAATGDNVVLCGPDLVEWLTDKRNEMIEG